MDGFKNICPSSPSTKHSAIPKLSSPDLQSRIYYSNDVGKVNENDKNANQIGSKMPSPKNFMSPTISTASKVASAKKVLGERNEQSAAIIAAAHFHKLPASNVGFNDRNRSSSLTPNMSSKVSELDQAENISVDDPSSQPYDPLTNYLSPRPKFLRYKPNRRLEFLLQRESERKKEGNPQELIEEEESSQSVYADGSSSSSSAEGSPEQDDNSSLRKDSKGSRPSANEERNPSDDDEEMENFEVDERHWHFIKALKTLLLLGILILSTMCISSMNSPTPPPYIEALQEVKEGYQKIQESLFRLGRVNIAPGINFLGPGIINGNETVTAKGIQEEEMVFSIGMQETGETINIALEVLDLQKRENMEVYDNHTEKAGENFYQVAEKLELRQLENEAHSMPDSQIQFMSHWVHNQSAEIKINLGKKGAEPVKAEQEKDEAVTEASGGVTNKGNLNHEFDLWRESVREWMERVENISGGTSKTSELRDRENSENSQVPQNQLILGAKATEHTDSDIHNTNGTKVDLEEEDQIKRMKSQFIAKAVGVSVIAIAMVSGLLRLRNRRTTKVSQLRVKSSSGSVAVETKGDSPVYLSPSVHSEEKAFKELHQNGVPKVELLGEFMVGEISSSIKHCGLKSKKVEGEESNFSVSQDKRPRRKPPSSVNDVPLYSSGSSAAEFPSCGSFTAQANIMKKEDGNDGEEIKKMTTPVRRSNRIRNRAVRSPDPEWIS